MATYLLDTSITSLLQRKHVISCSNLAIHKNDDVLISTITVEESIGGSLALLRKGKSKQQQVIDAKLVAEVVMNLGTFFVISPTVAALDRFDQLVSLKLNVGKNDLRIAAMALEIHATVVTANIRDFGRVPGLKWEDWSQ